MHDQSNGAARFQHVVNRRGYTGFVRPVEGLAEGNQPVWPGHRPRKVLGSGSHPADVRDAQIVGDPATLGEHGWVGVEADSLLEQVRESDSNAARAAASIEEPPATVQTQFLGENSLKLRRVSRSPPPVMSSGALIDRGVVWHDDRMPA